MIAQMRGEKSHDNVPVTPRVSINNFTNNAYSKIIHPSGNLKV